MTLWTPTRVGAIDLPHRLAMAPMTRDRSRADGVPTDLNREYYTQRASMALIITEGTQPSPDGQGYLLTPGIYTADHIDGWRAVRGPGSNEEIFNEVASDLRKQRSSPPVAS
ncbi:hypothetical protein ACSDR0_44760 [Streptosporangium sp. G11]|uniref:oxidoreductase n=1 Tax=Streptosporangium sp. G11 TaxID=3436926 RepID=UPI003EB8928C